ncbi:hypothetical protein [Streptacidiphilus sp. PAMC 29251]
MNISDESVPIRAPQSLLTREEIDLYRRLADLQTLDTTWRVMDPAARQASGFEPPEQLDLAEDDPALLRLLALGALAEDPSVPGGYRLIEPLTLEHELVNEAKERALAKQEQAFADLAAVEQRAGILAELQAAYAYGRRSNSEATHEYVTGIEAINTVLTRLVSRASRELLTAQPSPRKVSAIKLAENRDLEALERGVAMRTLYAPAAIGDPRWLREYVEPAMSRGAQVRVVDTPVPFLRLICVDRTWLVTEVLDPEQAEHDPRTRIAQALVTRDPATVAAFIHNFERDWAQARPLSLLPPTEQRNPIQQAIITALKTGADHEAIAKQLNITSRTVTKHATAHRTTLGATPGFQHGYLTAHQEITDQQPEAG